MLLSKPTLLTGFAYGCSYPSLFFDMRRENIPGDWLEELSLTYFEMAGVSRPSPETTPPRGGPGRLVSRSDIVGNHRIRPANS